MINSIFIECNISSMKSGIVPIRLCRRYMRSLFETDEIVNLFQFVIFSLPAIYSIYILNFILHNFIRSTIWSCVISCDSHYCQSDLMQLQSTVFFICKETEVCFCHENNYSNKIITSSSTSMTFLTQIEYQSIFYDGPVLDKWIYQ